MFYLNLFLHPVKTIKEVYRIFKRDLMAMPEKSRLKFYIGVLLIVVLLLLASGGWFSDGIFNNRDGAPDTLFRY